MVVLVDLDDTIERLLDAWCCWLNRVYGTTVQPEDVTEWDITKFFPSLTKEEVFAPLYTGFFWSTVKPKSDAMEYLWKIHENGDQIYIITSSNFETIKPKFDCIIGRYFPWVPYSNVIVASNKQMVSGDVLVDDGIHNLIGGKYEKILMTAPHNKYIDLSTYSDIRRANSWSEAYDIIQEIKRERQQM